MVAAGPLHNSNITKKYIDWEVHWHLEVNIIMSIEYNTINLLCVCYVCAILITLNMKI